MTFIIFYKKIFSIFHNKLNFKIKIKIVEKALHHYALEHYRTLLKYIKNMFTVLNVQKNW